MKASDLNYETASTNVKEGYDIARRDLGEPWVYSFSSFSAGFEHGITEGWRQYNASKLHAEDRQAYEEAAPEVKAHYNTLTHIAGRPFKAFAAGYSLGFTDGSRAVQVTDDTTPQLVAPAFRQAREFIDEERRMECIKRTSTLAEARKMWAFVKGLDS